MRPTSNTTPKRRKNNDGTVSSYTLTSGETRYRIAYTLPLPGGQLERKFKKGYLDAEEAENALDDIRVDIRRGEHIQETRDTLDGYAHTYFDSLRVKPSTLDAYRRHYNNHISPTLGKRKLSDITTTDLNVLYRQLERSGRKDQGHAGQPLSAATVRHVHAILVQVFSATIADGLRRTNPATARNINPPTLREAAAPEMTTWDDEQARQFLAWSKDANDYLYLAWYLLLATGMRRGELLALRWRDINLSKGTIAVTRAVNYVKIDGHKRNVFGPPKSGKKRTIDIDAGTVAELQTHRDRIGAVLPEMVTPDSPVLANRHGQTLNPERFSVQFQERLVKAQATLPDLPKIKVHELRHSHATMLLVSGTHPKVVQERLGHATINITLGIYSHVTENMQRGAADTIGGLLTQKS
jgi:integrase